MKKMGKKVSSLAVAGFMMVCLMTGCGANQTKDVVEKSDNSGSKGIISVVSREDGSGTRGAFVELTGIEEKDADGNKVDHTTKDAAQDFYNFIMSAEGQQIVEENKYIKIDEQTAAFSSNNASGKVVVAGSSSVTPVMEKLAEKYQSLNANVTIEVQQSDSTTGMTSAMEGTCDIGMASRELSEDEAAKLTATPIALDGIAVIVNKSNEVSSLTMEQIKKIYIGELTEWSFN